MKNIPHFSHQELIIKLVNSDYLKTPRIVDVFRKIDRKDFVPEKLWEDAYVNVPLPIGWGQTISQPLTVAFMLETLAPKRGDKILDIGSGSGWQTALLACIVGSSGHVYAIERVPELCELGQKNVVKYNFKNVTFFTADAVGGLPEFSQFDRIIAAASASELPGAWKTQLKIGGRIVAPVGSSIWRYDKIGEGDWEERECPGFAFVPLIGS